MAEPAETTKSTEPAKVSSRGTSFPVLSLPEAAKIVRDAGAYGKQHTTAALAAYGGHQTANSGPWKQKAAALREWGLIIAQGAETVALTDRALQIAHPESQEKAQAALLDAFRGSKLYMTIYDDLAKNSDLNIAVLGNKAVTSHGVSVASKDKFTKSFVESAAAVGLAERVGTDKVKILPMPGDTLTEPLDEQEDDGATDEPSKKQVSSKSKRRVGTPVIDQTWLVKDGEVSFSISSDKPIAASTYTEIGKVVTAVEGLVKLLGVEEEDNSGDGATE
jgi:hypothetical protein